MSPEYDALRQIRSKNVPVLKTEIGPVLKAARLKKGLAMEAVARQTRISKRYLEALEADRFDEFPALVYLRGFLKSYCEFLETDFDTLWAQVEAATAPPPPAASGSPAPAPSTPAPAAAGPAPAAPAPAPKTPAPEPQAPRKGKPEPATSGPAHAAHPAPAKPSAHAGHGHAPSHGGTGAAGAIAFSLVFAGGLGWYMVSNRAPEAPPPPPEPPKALQPLATTVEPTVLIRLKDDAWMRVTLDGQTVFEGRAPRGSTQEWKPAKGVGLRTTSPEAVSIELNGQPRELGAAGPDGEYRVDVP